ncbi:kinesin-like protein KIF14 [Hetaerina americana]|uniref:kinesin-like protein KIF14 n=1 Tax=Hetaerina americana TaxID=62018 RepID=UPI003A7F2990
MAFQTPENCNPNRGAAYIGRDDANFSATPECFGTVHMETPRKSSGSLVPPEGLCWGATETSAEDETSNLTVGVRVRPLNARESSDPTVKVVLSIKDNEVFVSPSTDSGLTHQFSYDHCFCSEGADTKRHHTAGVTLLANGGGSQEDVYNTLVRPLLEKAFEGYNVCLFAYGQTGSGKSYSMMGVGMEHMASEPKNEAGIIPRFCHQLFQKVARLAPASAKSSALMATGASSIFNQITVEVSYFEIYNEKIHDLLGDSDGGVRARRVPLRVREHPVFGPHVVDLSTHGVVSYKDMQEWILVGNSRRATAATEMNDKSSRSHSIFSIILTQTEKDSLGGGDIHDTSRRSKINLVDLAGSERLSSQTSASGDRMREGVSINRSLLTLGKVIAALSEGNGSAKKRTFIPYRDSVLTWLLRESLGGNSRTAMLATVSPASVHVEETLSTLRYATQAASIVNRVRVNEGHHDRLIRELRAEIERLRALRLDCEHQRRFQPRRIIPPSTRAVGVGPEDAGPDGAGPPSADEVGALRHRLKLSEEQLARAERTWGERVAEADKCKSAELAFLRRQGLAVCLSNKEDCGGLSSESTVERAACLINLSPDPGLSGTLLYILPPGKVRIGRVPSAASDEQADSEVADILLDGPLVGSDHCVVENNAGKLTLHPGPMGPWDTYVNGHSVPTGTELALKHGDRLVIGGNHFFLVNNPSEQSPKGGNMKTNSHFVDFEFARQELKLIQEERLKRELEKAKQNAVKELQRANEEAEGKLKEQRLAFEKQINTLGHTLAQQEELLECVARAKGELEHQKAALEAELQRGREKKMAAAEKALSTSISPYTSNFFQDLEDVLNHMEILQEEADAISVEGEASASLHEMQFMVKEANGLCRSHNLTYGFQHVQVLNTDGLLQPKVKVCDLERKAWTYWDQGHFIHVLNVLRDYEEGDSLQAMFDCSESWEAEEEELGREVSLSGSGQWASPTRQAGIVIEMGCVTKVLNDSISQLSSSMLQEDDESDKDCSGDESRLRLRERMSIGRGLEIGDCSSPGIQGKVEDEVNAALLAIEEATEDLLAIFSRVSLPLVSDPIPAIEEFEMAMHRMRAEVESAINGTCAGTSSDKEMGGWNEGEVEAEGSPREMMHKSCIVMTPVKSSLRSPACTENGGPKKVRFFFPDVSE